MSRRIKFRYQQMYLRFENVDSKFGIGRSSVHLNGSFEEWSSFSKLLVYIPNYKCIYQITSVYTKLQVYISNYMCILIIKSGFF